MMFKRVLIAEDHESISISVRKTLADCGITNIEYTYYCDDALMHIKKNVNNEQPFDLLITDLSFEEDHRLQNIKDGATLVTAVRQVQPNIKVLVFSGENKLAIINSLFHVEEIDGYVRKARHDSKELKMAFEAISQDKKYLSTDLRQTVKLKNAYEFSEYDITIISLLSHGTLQKDIPAFLQKNEIKPSGLSSVEKRLNQMKEALSFNKNEQLIAYCKDFGII